LLRIETLSVGRQTCLYDLLTKFKCMLSADNLRSTGRWLDRARLWRIILLSNEEGWFEPSAGLAFSLYAMPVGVVHQHPDSTASQTLLRRVLAFARHALHFLLKGALGVDTVVEREDAVARSGHADDPDLQGVNPHADEQTEVLDEVRRLSVADCRRERRRADAADCPAAAHRMTSHAR
jgi:hypothetical protein